MRACEPVSDQGIRRVRVAVRINTNHVVHLICKHPI